MSYWKRLQLRKLFHPGIGVSITLTYRCNLNCDYCTNKNGTTENPKDKGQLTVKQWLSFIKTFPIRINEVVLTGGSPELYHGYINLINYLLDSGYFVSLYTNLLYTDFNEVKKSERFKIIATYHHGSGKHKFITNYQNCKHEIEVDEIETGELYFSRIKPFEKLNQKPDKNVLRFGPDGMIFINCFDRNKYYLK